MPIGYESILFHDATEQELRAHVDRVAARVVSRLGWKGNVHDLPNGVRFRVSVGWRSWGEVVTIEVEEKSIRIASSCRFGFPLVDRGRNRENVEVVRLALRRSIYGSDRA